MSEEKKPAPNSQEEIEARIQDALMTAINYGQIDGAHHKMWVIDQMVQKLLGSEKNYNDFVDRYMYGDDEGNLPEGFNRDEAEDAEYEWDQGIAP